MSAADDYVNKRMKALGLTTATLQTHVEADDYVNNRQMDLGLIPDTRKKNQPPTQAEMQQYGMSANPANSQIMQQAQNFGITHPEPKKRGFVGSILHGIGRGFNAVDVLTKDIVKHTVPDAPMFTKDGKLSDINARDAFLERNPIQSTGSAGLDKALDVGGALGSMFVPMNGGPGGSLISGASKGAAMVLGTKLGSKLVGGAGNAAVKLAGSANPMLANAGINISTNLANKAGMGLVKGGVLGAGYGAMAPLAFGSGNLDEVPKSIAENAVAFGVGDAALPFAGAGVSAAIKKLAGTKLGDALGSFVGKAKTDIKAPAVETYANPTRYKVAGTEEAFAAVLPKILNKATERMTPPLENQNELAKWVRNHLNNDGHEISLNEVRKLDYEDLRQFAEEMRTKINIEDLVQTTAHDMGYGNIYEGVPAPIKQKIAYDAQSRVYGVPAPEVKISRTTPNARTTEKPKEMGLKLGNGISPGKPTPDPTNQDQSGLVLGNAGLKPSSKATQTVSEGGVKEDGLTIMEKYFPDGKVDPQILAKLPLKERIKFQEEQTPGFKKPITFDSKGRPSDATHLKKLDLFQREEVSHNNAIAEKLGLTDDIEELFAQGLTSKEVRQKLTYKLPSDYNEAKAVVESVREFRGIPSSSDTPEFEAWLKTREPGATKTVKLDDNEELSALDLAKKAKAVGPIKSMEPNVRKKVVDFFNEAEQTAIERLRAKEDSESVMHKDEIRDRATLLASQMVRKDVEFNKWYGQMIDDFGEESKNLFPQIWTRAENLIKQAELRAKVIAHVPGVNQGVDSLNGDKLDIARLEEAIAKSGGWKNKNRFLLNRETTERNFEDIMGDDADIMKKTYIEPIKRDAADRQRFITKERDDIKELGIKYKSKEDALVQEYGEGKISDLELAARSPKNWEKIKRAAGVMRAKYDQYLDAANAVLEKNGYDPIPKRKDYFPHYEEVDGILRKFGMGFEDNSLPTEINGLTANLKPGKNYFGHALQRSADESTLGAMAGHDRYIEGISKLIYQTSNIKRLRGLENYLKKTHEGTTQLTDFVANLTDYTNVLAGKKTELDRSPEAVGGRNLYTVVDWLKRRVGANMIGGSVSSALTNSIPITQLVAATDKAAVLKGLTSAVKNIKGTDEISMNSNFLNRKFTSHKLAMGGIDKAQNIAGSMFKFVDHFTSNIVIRAKYAEGLKKGVSPKDALHAADQYASRMMADRSEGSMPTLFHSRGFGALTQFQLEVNNQISHLFKDLPRGMSKKKYASVLTQIFVYSYLYNEVYEKITGNRPAFDPIGITVDAASDFKDNKKNHYEDSWNLTKNIAGVLPFSSVFTGGRIPMSAALPDVEGLIRGKANIWEEMMKPLKYLIPPFGGGQISKTITGATNLGLNPFEKKESGVYGQSSGKDVLKYPIEKSPANIVRGLVFGKNAFPETGKYYDDSSRPLSAKQTETYESLSKLDKKDYIINLMKEREIETLKNKYKDVANNEDMSDAEKQKKIDALQKKYDEMVTNK